MKHQFRQKLKSGEQLLGTMLTLGSPEVAEILMKVGFDWLFVDAEHGTFTTRDIQTILQSVGANKPCLVRLAASEEVAIKKALDVGAAGIIAPMVNSAEHAARVVSYAKYAPQGTRGVGIGRAHGYGLSFQSYIEQANDNVTIVLQAEHIEAVENIESIVQVPGIDAILIGPYDLSASLGKLGQVNHPDVTSAIAHVTQTCLAAGVRLGVFGMSAEAVKPYLKQGYSLITVGVDTMLLGQAAGSLLAEFNGANQPPLVKG